MNKAETYEFLRAKNIPFETVEHEAVFNMEEMSKISLPHPEADAKNLFVRDDKHLNFYLITVRGDKRVNLKEFRKANGTRPLTFASETELFEILRLTPGSVTPLGLLSDDERKVKFYIDSDLVKGLVGVHQNENTATVFLKTEDLTKLIKEHGNETYTVEI